MPWYYNNNMWNTEPKEDNMSDGNTWSSDILKNIPLVLYAVAVVLHSLGIVLLLKLRRKRNQDLIILNLSVSELFMCLLDILQNILSRDRFKSQSTVQQAVTYVIIVNCCFFVVPSFLIIITLTIDRFLEVFFNIKYELFFSNTVVKITLAVQWLVGFILGTVLISVKATSGAKVRLLIFMFVFPVLQGSFLIIAVITYSYIYKRFRRTFRQLRVGKVSPDISSSQATQTESQDSQKESQGNTQSNADYSMWRGRLNRAKRIVLTLNVNSIKQQKRQPVMFRRRNFFAPTLILFTFVLFVVIPDMLNLFFHYLKLIHWSEDTQNLLLCLYSIGFITDGVIYIFLQKHLRNMLLKMVSHRTWVRQMTSTTYCDNSQF